MEEQYFFISTKDKRGEYVSYVSEKYRISELEVMQIIRLMVIERRNIRLGNKILEVYRDATGHRKEEVASRLRQLGINDDEKTRTIPKNSTKK